MKPRSRGDGGVGESGGGGGGVHQGPSGSIVSWDSNGIHGCCCCCLPGFSVATESLARFLWPSYLTAKELWLFFFSFPLPLDLRDSVHFSSDTSRHNAVLLMSQSSNTLREEQLIWFCKPTVTLRWNKKKKKNQLLNIWQEHRKCWADCGTPYWSGFTNLQNNSCFDTFNFQQ